MEERVLHVVAGGVGAEDRPGQHEAGILERPVGVGCGVAPIAVGLHVGPDIGDEEPAEVIGILDGFEGLVEGHMRELTKLDVLGIINLGGTILGTSNKGDPFHYPVETASGIEFRDYSKRALEHYHEWELEALIAIGGDGTMIIAEKFSRMGMNIVGVPKTIDNDLAGTDITFGHDSAVAVATDAVDRLQTTASAHHRVMVIELMGRHAGWIALRAGVAGGGDVILIPEIPFKWDSMFDCVVKRSTGAKFSIICVAEGAKPIDGEPIVRETDMRRTDPILLGGIAGLVANRIEEETKLVSRSIVLGHLQRGGSPTAFDRILATKYGSQALEATARKEFACMVSLHGDNVVTVPLKEVAGRQRLVSPNSQLVMAARAVGTEFGN